MTKNTEEELKKWVKDLPEIKVKDLCFKLLYDNIICESGYNCYIGEDGKLRIYEDHSGEEL